MSTGPGYRNIDGVCAQTDPEAFFPEKGGSTREAKKICFACEERAGCIRTALDGAERWGIWGGMSERDRRVLLPHWKNVGPQAQRALIDLLLNVRTFADLVAFLKPYRLANEAAARAKKKLLAEAGNTTTPLHVVDDEDLDDLDDEDLDDLDEAA